MKEIYYLTLLVLAVIGSSYITAQMPRLKYVFKRLLKRFKSSSQKSSIHALEQRITDLEQQIRMREYNRTAKTKKIVINYLKELQNGKNE